MPKFDDCGFTVNLINVMAGQAELCVQINSNLVKCVIGRNLARNNLNGGIPVAWTEKPVFAALQSLNLEHNKLGGEIPNANFLLT